MDFAKKKCGMDQAQVLSAVHRSSWHQRSVTRNKKGARGLADRTQILLDKKYGRAVDWWAFGVLIYQMLLQQSPFRGEDEDEIYDAILADEPLYPIHMPRDSVSILQKLLMRDPDLRLGSGPTDAQEIMSHAFFRNINWDDFRDKNVTPPFIPQIKTATDTSNFDSEFTSVTPVLTPVQSGKYITIARIRVVILTGSCSIDASNARRIPRLFIFGRLHLRKWWGYDGMKNGDVYPRGRCVMIDEQWECRCGGAVGKLSFDYASIQSAIPFWSYSRLHATLYNFITDMQAIIQLKLTLILSMQRNRLLGAPFGHRGLLISSGIPLDLFRLTCVRSLWNTAIVQKLFFLLARTWRKSFFGSVCFQDTSWH